MEHSHSGEDLSVWSPQRSLAGHGAAELAALAGTPQHIWAATYPFIDSVLFISQASLPPGSGHLPTVDAIIQAFDPDGDCINEIFLNVPLTPVCAFPVDQFLESCKLEGGIKHAHLVVRTNLQSRVLCRLQSNQGAVLLGEPTKIFGEQATFFPIQVSANQTTIFPLLNYGNTPAVVRCRLYIGKRSPETSLVIPPRGCRVLNIKSDFEDFFPEASERPTQAYVRLSTRSDRPVGIQMIETIPAKESGILLTAVS